MTKLPHETAPKRAAIYVRVSTGRQAKKGLSLDAQIDRCRDRVEAEGWKPVEVYVERGVSGRRADRPELSRLLGSLGEIDVLVIWKLDRFGRSNRDLQVNFERLESAEVELISIRDNLDTSTAAGRLLRNVLAALAEFESDLIGERVSAARERGRALGLHNGRAPYGYRKGEGNDKGRLLIDPAEAEMVRRIFAEWIDGTSQYSITQRLNNEGVRPRTAKAWTQGSISQLLRNRTYAGGTREGEERCRCEHEPIIEPATFAQAQTLLGGRHRSGGPNRRTAAGHLFLNGFLRCGLCGSAMMPRTDKRKGYEVYKCSSLRQHGPGSCDAPVYHRDPLERGLVGRLTSRHVDVRKMIERHEENVSRRIAEVTARRKEAERGAIQAADNLARVKSYFQEGRVDPEDWREQKEELAAERNAAESAADRLSRQEKDLRLTLAERDAEQEVLNFLSGIQDSALAPVRDAETLDGLRAGFRRIWNGWFIYPAGSAEARALSADGETNNVLVPVTEDGKWGAQSDLKVELPTPVNSYQAGLTR